MAQSWMDQIFGAQAVHKGDVVRRSKANVEAICSLADLISEVKARGFHLIETGGQVIVICNDGAITIHT